MRKQLAVKILKSSFDKLEKIKEETGLSNAKIIEMLLENYDNTNTNTSNNTSITEERVAEMIQEALANINTSVNTDTNTSSDDANTSTSTNVNTKEDDSNYYILRKTHKTRLEKEGRMAGSGALQWPVMPGTKSHYDKDGTIIPFRFTGDDGVVYEPEEEEIKEIAEAYGKPVKIES
jgi:hypothetical protein